MTIVRELHNSSDFEEFIGLEDRIYGARAVRWPTFAAFTMSLLRCESAFVQERQLQTFGAFRDGMLVARSGAITDPDYTNHWGEELGHLILFEAMPDAEIEARSVIDAACNWLFRKRVTVVRVGCSHFEMPLNLEDDSTLPPIAMPQNPRYYHTMLKNVGFEFEKHWVGYRIIVEDSVVQKLRNWRAAIDERGCKIVSLRDLRYPECLVPFTQILNKTFRRHWGSTPLTTSEVAERMDTFSSFGVLESSAMAFRKEKPIGFTFSVRECTAVAVAKTRPIVDEERLNLGGETGVVEEARGLGIARGLVAHAYLDFIGHGARNLYYGPVLEDNTKSREIGESLGGRLFGSYVTYRKQRTKS